jgi:DNA repair exonuclease SbcCD ATPase subunit
VIERADIKLALDILNQWEEPEADHVYSTLEDCGNEIEKLRAELEAAKAEIEHLKQSRENFATHAENSLKQLAAKDAEIEEINLLKREVKELLSKKFSRFANEECWIYQGDGEDHLESLVCPVVISASRLLEIEKQRDELLEALQMLVRESREVADDYHKPRYTRLDGAILSAINTINNAEIERLNSQAWGY